jgi:glutathione S-transferase
MTARLHAFAESGNAWKCALALDLLGLPWEAVFVDFFRGATRTPAFRALNPMGEVPVLETGGRVLTQSGAILMNLAETTGRMGGTTPEEREEVLRWILWDNHKFSTQIGSLRFLRNFLPEEKRPAGVIPFLEGRMQAAYAVLDAHLAGRDWIVGAAPTIADLSCAGYLYYPEPYGFDRAAWPGIDAWLGRLAALPGWRHPYDMLPRAFPGAGA